jgi:hypothetical protein
MRVICIANTGKMLLRYPRVPFGTSEQTQYGQLEINQQYLVMGLITTVDGVLHYLIDDHGNISACPYQFFNIIDDRMSRKWLFKAFKIDDAMYSEVESLCGYYELVHDETHYEKLVDFEEEAHRTYFRRKIELEKEFADREFEE